MQICLFVQDLKQLFYYDIKQELKNVYLDLTQCCMSIISPLSWKRRIQFNSEEYSILHMETLNTYLLNSQDFTATSGRNES